MVKNGESKKSYNSREGLGIVEMSKMALYRPWAFSLMIVLIKCHMYGLAKKMLGVQ